MKNLHLHLAFCGAEASWKTTWPLRTGQVAPPWKSSDVCAQSLKAVLKTVKNPKNCETTVLACPFVQSGREGSFSSKKWQKRQKINCEKVKAKLSVKFLPRLVLMVGCLSNCFVFLNQKLKMPFKPKKQLCEADPHSFSFPTAKAKRSPQLSKSSTASSSKPTRR